MYKKIVIIFLCFTYYSVSTNTNNNIESNAIDMKYNIDPLDEDIQEYDIDDFAIDADISDSTRIETEQNIENEGLLAHFAYYFNYFLYSCYINYLIIKESLYTKGTHLYNHIDTIMHTKLHKI